MKYYLSLWLAFFSNCVSDAASFRLNSMLVIFVDLAFYTASFGTVAFLFDHVDTIGPWNEDQFLFFVAFMMAIDQLHMTQFAMSFWQLSHDIRLGQLDYFLLKPAPVLFPIFFRNIRVASLVNLPLVWGLLIFFGSKAGLSTLDWILLPPFVLLALTLIVSIEILITSAMFWTVENLGINFIRTELQSISRWPDFIYLFFFNKVFTFVVPVLLVGSVPSHILLSGRSIWTIFGMLAAIGVLWVLIRIAWRAGLRRYESASS